MTTATAWRGFLIDETTEDRLMPGDAYAEEGTPLAACLRGPERFRLMDSLPMLPAYLWTGAREGLAGHRVVRIRIFPIEKR